MTEAERVLLESVLASSTPDFESLRNAVLLERLNPDLKERAYRLWRDRELAEMTYQLAVADLQVPEIAMRAKRAGGFGWRDDFRARIETELAPQ